MRIGLSFFSFLGCGIIYFTCCCFCLGLSNKFALSWPTPNPSFAQGLGYSTFLQKTGPDKDFSSGAFGCVRNHGNKFHEGLDLFPVRTNSQGVAQDTIFAAINGTVAYMNKSSSDSPYGKYVVLEHDQFEPTLYTLYAHLNKIHDSLKIKANIKVAQQIGKMGNTASFRIPLQRSHLHFEVGIRLSGNFDTWYNRQGFKSKNKHNNFNGYNLVGLDPIKFYSEYQKSSFLRPIDYLSSLPTVAKIQVNYGATPNLLVRNPSLILNPENKQPLKSWICSFGPFGFPLVFEKSSQRINQPVRILSYDERHDSEWCRKLIINRNGKLHIADQLGTYLELIFLD